MFTRAGRMGNMASDIRSDGKEQGKKVRTITAGPCDCVVYTDDVTHFDFVTFLV